VWGWIAAIASLASVLAGGGADPVQPAPPSVRRFWTSDAHAYASPWYTGRHRVMIGFGCTPAPYYDPAPGCPHSEGFHHGIDVALPCGAWLFSAVDGVVAPARGPGAPGPAYGPRAFRIRVSTGSTTGTGSTSGAGPTTGVDVLLGHVRVAYVHPGDRVHRGDLVARADRLGAPDGCHLHLEVRPAGGGYASAVDPASYLGLLR